APASSPWARVVGFAACAAGLVAVFQGGDPREPPVPPPSPTRPPLGLRPYPPVGCGLSVAVRGVPSGLGGGAHSLGGMRSGWAAVLDVLCVLVFIAIGRATHAEGASLGGYAGPGWPCLGALGAGRAAGRQGRGPGARLGPRDR